MFGVLVVACAGGAALGRPQRRRSSRTSGCRQSSSRSRRWSRCGMHCGGRRRARGCRTCRPGSSGSACRRPPIRFVALLVVGWPAGADGVGFRKSCGRPRDLRHRIESRRRPPGRLRHVARQVGGLHDGRRADGPRGGPQLGALQSDSEQRRPRARDEGHCRGGRRRHRDSRRDAARSPARCSASSCSARSVRRSRFSA